MGSAIVCTEVPEAVGPYAIARWAGDLLFVSGQIGIARGDSELVSVDTVPQARQVMQNLEKILDEADLSWDEVVKVNIYLTDIADFSEVNKLYSEFLFACSEMPARVCYEVSKLPLGAKVEIELIAAKK